MKKLFASVLASIFILTGCSSKPGVSDLEEQFAKVKFPFCNQVISAKNFVKTDGNEIDGKTYEIAFEVELVLNKDVDFLKSDIATLCNSNMVEFLAVQQLLISFFPKNKDQFQTNYSKGLTVKKNATASFYKTEKGWTLQ